MEKISVKIDNYKPKKTGITNERQALIGEFLEEINSRRVPMFNPISPARMGLLLRYCKTKELYKFLADCRQANNFSKYFWWRLKC